jgi:hypothetical protein
MKLVRVHVAIHGPDGTFTQFVLKFSDMRTEPRCFHPVGIRLVVSQRAPQFDVGTVARQRVRAVIVTGRAGGLLSRDRPSRCLAHAGAPWPLAAVALTAAARG